MSRNRYVWLCVFIGLFFFIPGCRQHDAQKSKDVQTAFPVKVYRIEMRDFYETLDYVGNIKAQDEVEVFPRVSGKVVEKVKEDGAPVAKDEAVAFIDRDEVGLTYERAPVESPIAGVIGRVYVDIGTQVTPQTPVALVVNMDKARIDLDIPERYLPQVETGQEAEITVDAYAAEQFRGIVTKVSPVVDTLTRSAPVEITLDNPRHRLKPGMFARVRLIVQKNRKALVVLREALMGRPPDAYVFVAQDKRAALRKVTLGIRQGEFYEIKEGLKEGDLVVVMGQQRLFEGAQLTVELDGEGARQ